MSDWWEDMLKSRRKDGRKDAGNGIFNEPYPNSDDPQDDEENYAYRQGWDERRGELGKGFKWQ